MPRGKKKTPQPEGPETVTDKENRGVGKEKPVAREFSVADPVETLGRAIIGSHYPELKHQSVRYIFTTRASEEGKEPIICKPSKISGLNAWLADGMEDGEACPFFVIVVSQTHWEAMPAKGREAYLDGALAQLSVTKTGALKLVKPDISESSAVLARHGMYSKKLKEQATLIQEALNQPVLELEVA